MIVDTETTFPQVRARFDRRIGLFHFARLSGITAGQACIGVSFRCGYANRVGRCRIATLSTSAKEG